MGCFNNFPGCDIGECTANQALKKQPLAWYLEDKKDSSRAEFFVTAFVCVCVWGV